MVDPPRRSARHAAPRGRVRVGRLIVALLLLAVLFALGFAVGALWAGGDDGTPGEVGSTTIEVDVPVATITETFAEVTETVVVTG